MVVNQGFAAVARRDWVPVRQIRRPRSRLPRNACEFAVEVVDIGRLQMITLEHLGSRVRNKVATRTETDDPLLVQDRQSAIADEHVLFELRQAAL